MIGSLRLKIWKRAPSLLLCSSIPKPMHGVAPREVLGRNWWNKERRAAYQSTNFRCKACGVHKERAKYHQWLEAHELYRTDYRAGRMTYIESVPLCHFCHNYIHDGRLHHLLRKGEIHHAKFTNILQHGDAILRAAGLSKDNRADRDESMKEAILRGEVAKWEDWRMVLDGVEIPPKHESYEAWENYFE